MLSDRDEFGASIDNSKVDDDGMTKNNTESQLASLACLACSAVQSTYKDS